MKKLFYSLFAFAALAMTNTSCSDELENAGTNPNEVAVTFNVQLEKATGSRAAIGDGTTAKELQYAVYKDNGNGIGTIIQALSKETTVNDDLTAQVTFRLVKGQTYNFMFWAQKPGASATDEIADNAYYKVDKASGKVSVDYKTNKDANDEGRDAFYAVEKTLKVTGPINKTITLKRPFAQINVGTAIGSLKDAATADVKIEKSSMTIKKAANKLDIYTGKVSASAEAEDVTYTLANIPELTEGPTDAAGGLKNVTINNETKDYEYLAMNYILVDDHNKPEGAEEDGSHNASVNVDFTIYDDKDVAINTFEVPNVTVQRNWRTNIIGDIMNENVTFNVVIDPKFDNDHNYKVDEQLAYVLKNGGEYTVNGEMKIKEPLTVNGTSVILNLSEGSSIAIDPSVTTETDAIVVEGNSTLTINGTGSVTGTYDAIWAKDNAKVIINGGIYTGGTECIYARDAAKVVINGGTFQTTSEDKTSFAKPQYAVLNLKNNGVDGCDIEVFGGTFINFDPSNNVSENPAKDFVAEGYSSVKVGDSWVVAKGKAVATAADLATTLNNGGEVSLVADVTLDESSALNIAAGKSAQLNIAEGVIVTIPATTGVDLIKNSGKLTLSGNGTIAAGNNENSRRCVYNYGEMVIDGVKFVQTYNKKGAAINNEGKMTIKNATVESVFYAIWNSGANADLTIDGGTYKTMNDEAVRDTWAYCVNNINGAKMTINGGSFIGNHGVIVSSGNASAVTLNAGTYHCTATYTGNSDWTLYTDNGGTITYKEQKCTITSDNKSGAIYNKNGGITKQ